MVFQYCSRPGPNDITRVDEAPTEECDSGDANWARLASVPVDASGNAELEFCCPLITPTIGFRFRYLDREATSSDSRSRERILTGVRDHLSGHTAIDF